jgi:tetratricopeptide (TPR) repeat protein
MPGHAAGLRALERHLAGSGRREDVLPILEALVDATGDPEDAAAFARRASRIKRLEVGPIGIEDAELAKKALARRPSSWALAALDADARARRDDEALASIAGRRAARAVGPSAAAHAVAAAEALLRLGRTDDALAATKGALEADPRHPLALARAVELGLATGDLSLAASALETSGDAAGDPARGARDLFHAATLAEGRLGDAERALAILERAVVRDPSHAEATERAARLLEQFGRISDAEALLASRFALGGEPAALVRIAEHRADLLLNLEMREEARASLRAAVALRPDDLALQWRIAEIAGEDGAHAERAEALIQIARVVTDPAEVKTVFLDLGRLYDGPLPDPARAEASFRRVLQHDPNHLEALSHLASIGMALGNWQLALDATERLVSLSTSAPEKAKHLRALCRIHDQGFQNPRKAEAALQEARRIHPRDPETIDAGAAFYKAHGGGPPLLMWLDLAASALRDSVADTPAEPDAYRALARSLELRGRRDATRATLAVLDAIGEASQRERLGLGGYGATATTALLDGATGDLVAPSGLPTSLRKVFARMADGFASLASTDPREHGAAKADRLSPRDPPRMAAQKIARELGLPDLEVYAIATGRRPDVVLPGDPPVLVTTRAGLGGADDAEAAFRAGRAAWLARNRLAAPLLHSDADLGLLLLGLVRQFDARFPVDADEAAVEEAGRRIGRHIPRRERDAILPFALEAAGSRALDGATVRGAIAAAADAAGLLVCGRIDAALRAVAKDAGVGGPKQAAATPRGSRLLSFAVSEPYFEARRLAGIA